MTHASGWTAQAGSGRCFVATALIARGAVIAAALVLSSAGVFGQAAQEGRMYWIEIGGPGTIFSARRDGSDLRRDYFVGGVPTAVAVDPVAGKVYWSDALLRYIARADLGGPPLSPVIEPLVSVESPEDLALDLSAGKMYWISNITNLLQRANLDGSNVQNVASGNIDEPRGIALDLTSGKVYWTDQQFNWIRRVDLNGGVAESVVENLEADSIEAVAVDTDNQRIYWTEHFVVGDYSKIMRADLGPTGVTNLVPIFQPSGVTDPLDPTFEDATGELSGLTVDERAGLVYWSKRGGVGSSKIQRADLDGNHFERQVVAATAGRIFRLSFDDLYCGNRVRDPLEECDDGNVAERDGCDANCRSECGNGQRADNEECDDGNTSGAPAAAEDGCSTTCTLDPYWECPIEGQPCRGVCGDGKVRGAESCDDGNTRGLPNPAEEDGCSTTCTRDSYWQCPIEGQPCRGVCGDGEPKGSEICDDGNTLNCVGTCAGDCSKLEPAVPVCGDGIQCGTEECDPPRAGQCSRQCERLPHCGDGRVEVGMCRRLPQSCMDDSACPATTGYEGCDLAQGLCFESTTVGGACTMATASTDCDAGQECYVEPCDDGLSCLGGSNDNKPCHDNAGCPNGQCTVDMRCSADGRLFTARCMADNDCNTSVGESCQLDNGDDCIVANGRCHVAECNDGFVRDETANGSGKEDCDPPNGATCDDRCADIPRSSCRKRLGGLSFAQADQNSRSRRDRRTAEDGGINDEDERRDGWCAIKVNVCLGIPMISQSSAGQGGCDPQAVRSIDFTGSVPVSVDPGDWRSTEVASLSEAVKDSMVSTAVVSGRCVGGLKGKQCSPGADNECDRFLGDDEGRCGPGTGVEFTTPLASTDGPHCATIGLKVKEGERLRLRGRVRGRLSTGGSLEVDDNRLRLACRVGSGPTVTPIPTSIPTPTETPVPTDTATAAPTATETWTQTPTMTDTATETPAAAPTSTRTERREPTRTRRPPRGIDG